ncbi:DUF885 family protein [Actinomyces radicidentis]|uniref:DUF885 family protein n=1 Tax=Actinomyces radicidentis TaxID=111015 RepID=UPI0036F1DDA0
MCPAATRAGACTPRSSAPVTPHAPPGGPLRLARALIDLGIRCWLPVPEDVAALPGAAPTVAPWDRAPVTAVLPAHTVLSEGALCFEVDKQLGWPAQDLAYVLGERVWIAGRESDEHRAAAGEPFDERTLHDRGIALGSVGLGLLGARTRRVRRRVDEHRPCGFTRGSPAHWMKGVGSCPSRVMAARVAWPARTWRYRRGTRS